MNSKTQTASSAATPADDEACVGLFLHPYVCKRTTLLIRKDMTIL